MLTALPGLLAHQGFVLPGQLWGAWNPLILLALGGVAAGLIAAARRTGRGRRSRRGHYAALGFVALAIALGSPLDALAGALASAHMVQHVVLILVAAPLLVGGAPASIALGAAPRPVRGAIARLSRRAPVSVAARAAAVPVVAWLLHTAALWIWHSGALYDAAVRNRLVHGLEHMTFLGTAMLFWSLVLSPRRSRRLSAPAAVLVVFTMGLQSVFLSALLTFSPVPWYAVYAQSAPAWGLDPLTDQQLAGLVMWIPAGLVYLGLAIGIFSRWLGMAEPSGEAALAA